MEEVVAIIAIFVVLPAIIVQAVVRVKRAKYEAQAPTGASDGLRASELQRLIREAVEDAVEPLHARLDALDVGAPEDAPESGRLDPAVLSDALDAEFDDPDEVAAVRRRARS